MTERTKENLVFGALFLFGLGMLTLVPGCTPEQKAAYNAQWREWGREQDAKFDACGLCVMTDAAAPGLSAAAQVRVRRQIEGW